MRPHLDPIDHLQRYAWEEERPGKNRYRVATMDAAGRQTGCIWFDTDEEALAREQLQKAVKPAALLDELSGKVMEVIA